MLLRRELSGPKIGKYLEYRSANVTSYRVWVASYMCWPERSVEPETRAVILLRVPSFYWVGRERARLSRLVSVNRGDRSRYNRSLAGRAFTQTGHHLCFHNSMVTPRLRREQARLGAQ